MPPVVNEKTCISCGDCYEACQSDVFYGFVPENIASAQYPEECWHCNACVSVCPTESITLRIPLPMMVLYQERTDSV